MAHQDPAVDLAAANVANFSSFLALQAGLAGSEVRHDGAVTWVANPDPMFWFNMVSRVRLAPGDVRSFAGEVRATHERLGTDVMLWLSPLDTPDDLAARLEAEGFRPIGVTPAMAIELGELVSPAVPDEVKIERVGDAETLRRYVGALATAYGMTADAIAIWGRFCQHAGLEPGGAVHNFLGSLHGEPVCGATVYLGDDGVAGIYGVGTAPSARRRGIGAMVTAAALAEARRRGYRYGILQSSAMAANLYRAMGFRDTFEYRTCGWFPARPSD